METTRRYSDVELYRRLLLIARPYWKHIFALFLLSLLAIPLALLNPLPLKIAVDSAVGSKELPGFLTAVLPASATNSAGAAVVVATVLLVGTTLLSRLQDALASLLRTYTGQKLIRGFRARLFGHVQRLSLAYHDSKGATDSIYRIQNDAPALNYIAIEGVIPFVISVSTVVSLIYVTARMDAQLALVALLVSPPLFLISWMYRRCLRPRWHEVKRIESTIMAVVHEALGALRVVKAFGQEGREQARFSKRSDDGMRAKMRVAMIEGFFGILIALTTTAGTGAVLLIGVRHVQSGLLTVGELLMIMAYISQLYTPIRQISRKAGSIQSHLASAERALSLLDEQPDVAERPDARSISRASGAVAFRHVSFGYATDLAVLHDVSFEIEPGSCVGIAGTTGSGKTTLTSLLLRLYDPANGQILLDGVDLRDYKLADLRNQFAVVLQEPVLFSTTIAENIAYGRVSASQAEIEAAARLANAHDFINRLPQGYDTQVGERGMRLSGGERQRISLARAFLKDAPILILDEPTSSVDVNTEAEIMDALHRLMRGRTTFIIAHRLSTLDYCDVQLCMERGRLISAGHVSAELQKTSRTAIELDVF